MLFNRNSSGVSFVSGILQGYAKTLVLDRGVTSFKWNSPIKDESQLKIGYL